MCVSLGLVLDFKGQDLGFRIRVLGLGFRIRVLGLGFRNRVLG